MIACQRGTCGNFRFSQAQIEQLRAMLAAQQSKAIETPGIGTPVYELILSFIGIKDADGKYVARSDVDPAVFAWVSAAGTINANKGLYADYIRRYTKVQYEIRGGTEDPLVLNDQASNEIALEFARDIVDRADRSLPSIVGIGAIDGGAVLKPAHTKET